MSISDWQSKLEAQSVTILDSQTTSSAVDLYGTNVVGIIVPSGFDGATITFKGSTSIDGTFYDLFNSNDVQLTVNVTAGRMYQFNSADLAAIQYIKLVSDSAQSGDTALTLITRSLS